MVGFALSSAAGAMMCEECEEGCLAQDGSCPRMPFLDSIQLSRPSGLQVARGTRQGAGAREAATGRRQMIVNAKCNGRDGVWPRLLKDQVQSCTSARCRRWLVRCIRVATADLARKHLGELELSNEVAVDPTRDKVLPTASWVPVTRGHVESPAQNGYHVTCKRSKVLVWIRKSEHGKGLDKHSTRVFTRS